MPLMVAFPAMTPAAVWDLHYDEYRLMLAHITAPTPGTEGGTHGR